MVEDFLRNGWRTRFMPVEVGSLGFGCHSLSKAYGTLCITGTNKEEPQAIRIRIRSTFLPNASQGHTGIHCGVAAQLNR